MTIDHMKEIEDFLYEMEPYTSFHKNQIHIADQRYKTWEEKFFI